MATKKIKVKKKMNWLLIAGLGLGAFLLLKGGQADNALSGDAGAGQTITVSGEGLGSGISDAIGNAVKNAFAGISQVPNITYNIITGSKNTSSPSGQSANLQPTVKDVVTKSYATTPNIQTQLVALSQGYRFNPFTGLFQ